MRNLCSEADFEEAYANRSPEFYTPILADVIRFGHPGPLLDLGAGLGLVVELAQIWGLKAVGLEGSDYAVQKARARCAEIDVRVHDLGQPFPFKDGEFANVLLNQVIEHIDSKRAAGAIAESWRVLRPGGRIFILSPSRWHIAERRDRTHINMLLPSELRELLTRNGFQIINEPNWGLWFWPHAGPLTGLASSIAHRILPADWISGTANAIAVKGQKLERRRMSDA